MFSFYSNFREKVNQKYVQLLKKENTLGIDNKTYFLVKNFSILYPLSNISEKNNNDSNLGVEYPKNLKLEEKEAISTIKVHLGVFEKAYSIKNTEEDFINLINYIESKKRNYVLITTPFSYLYNKNIEKYQKGAFKEMIYNNYRRN